MDPTDPRRIMNFLDTIGVVTRPPDREWERERERQTIAPALEAF